VKTLAVNITRRDGTVEEAMATVNDDGSVEFLGDVSLGPGDSFEFDLSPEDSIKWLGLGRQSGLS
jgi:hypothetical protein